MLTTDVIHPGILGALAAAGHGSTVLIADGNYPMTTGTSRHAERVFLNFRPGLISATDILAGLVTVVPIEAAHVMRPGDGQIAPIFDEFRTLLGGVELAPLDRAEFYEAARSPQLALAIASGDQRLFGTCC